MEGPDACGVVAAQQPVAHRPPPERLMVADLVIQKEHGPVFANDEAAVSADVFRALGATVEVRGRKCVITAGPRTEEASAQDGPANRTFLPVALLKDLLPSVESVEVDAKRKAVNVVIIRPGYNHSGPLPEGVSSDAYETVRQRIQAMGLDEKGGPGLKRTSIGAGMMESPFAGSRRARGAAPLLVAFATLAVLAACALLLARRAVTRRRKALSAAGVTPPPQQI